MAEVSPRARAGRPPGARSRRGARRTTPLRRGTTPEQREAQRAEKAAERAQAQEEARQARIADREDKAAQRAAARALAKPKQRGGAPTLYRTSYDEIARKMALLGATDVEIAQAFDVTVETLNNWKRQRESFAASIRAGKVMADSEVVDSLFNRAKGYSYTDYKVFLPEGYVDKETGKPIPVIVPYTRERAPDTNAAKFWLMNRQRDLWRERQEVAVADPLTAMSPDERLAQVVEIMAKARALLAQPDPEDEDGEITDAEYDEVEG